MGSDKPKENKKMTTDWSHGPAVLKALRETYFHSISETARQLGVSRSCISKIEKGHRTITLNLLEKYSETYEIPLLLLLTRILTKKSLDTESTAG